MGSDLMYGVNLAVEIIKVGSNELAVREENVSDKRTLQEVAGEVLEGFSTVVRNILTD